ncbi:unnamed protein product [Miscanthus lutarioriparius]|uniref:Uncharacterized protein n=1 Tax=Miscanthus lutarioriparius TaxID=422564 RepID=A0A811QEF9_9POAL|nr:unnamed protein product [Miscanthus lutarioriparius]
MDSFQHKSKDDEKHSRLQGMEADTTGEKEHEHGKEMSEQHGSQVHTHDQGNKHGHSHGHGHGHREEHVGGGRERADPAEYLDMGGMTPGAFLEIRYRAATGRPYDRVERLISSEQMAKQQSEEEAEAGREENKGVIYEF